MRKLSRKSIVKKLDQVFSLYVRNKYAKDGFCECITCGRKYPIKQIQCGHFMSRKNYSTRWELENVAPQCFGCNCMQQGKSYEWSLKIGQKQSQKMYHLSKQTVKFSNEDLLEKISYFQKKLSNFK